MDEDNRFLYLFGRWI